MRAVEFPGVQFFDGRVRVGKRSLRDAEEIHVDEPARQVVALDLPRHREHAILADGEVDQDVRPRRGVQDVVQVLRVDAHVHRRGAVPVDDRRDPADRAHLAGDALPGSRARLRRQLLFHAATPMMVRGIRPAIVPG